MTKAEGYELYALTHSLRADPRARDRGGPRRRRACSASPGTSSWRSTSPPSAVRRSSATAPSRRIARSRATTAFPRPTSPRATPSSCRWRSPGPKSSAPPPSSSASTRSTTRAIPTAGRSISKRSSAWRRSRRRPASRAARSQILAPLLRLSKADIIRRGVALGLDYGLTHSCYDPAASGAPCGHCDSCRLRAQGFDEAGIADPLLGATRLQTRSVEPRPLNPERLNPEP